MAWGLTVANEGTPRGISNLIWDGVCECTTTWVGDTGGDNVAGGTWDMSTSGDYKYKIKSVQSKTM